MVRLSDYPYNSCPFEAKVTSSSSGRLNVGTGKRVGTNPGYCFVETVDPSFFIVSGSGIQHDVGGFKYFYKRA